MSWIRNPWGRPRWLALITAMYVLWSVVPVLLAIAFAFNAGRSRTTWQGFSFRWFTGETGSVMHDPALRDALGHTLLLAVICVAIATPLGVALALVLQRWRGRGSGTVNSLMLLSVGSSGKMLVGLGMANSLGSGSCYLSGAKCSGSAVRYQRTW